MTMTAAIETAPALQAQVTRTRGDVGFVLPGQLESVAVARTLTRDATQPGIRDAAVRCVSELVANAAIHSRSGRPGGRISVTLQTEPHGRLLIEVVDEGAPGRPHVAAPADEHGRGLGIVDVLAETWGVKPLHTGRCTWCRLVSRYPNGANVE
jgi:anti-sigma regulatory factor (Ser/Thr protein kinase)